MQINVNISKHNFEILEKEMRNYNIANRTDMDIETFKEMIFLWGLSKMQSRRTGNFILMDDVEYR